MKLKKRSMKVSRSRVQTGRLGRAMALTAMLVAFTTATAQTNTTKDKTSVPMQQVTPQRPQGQLPAGELIVQGTVKDSHGETLPMASVRVRETKAGAVADADGNFVIGVPRGQAVTLDFSYAGMKPTSKKYDGKRNYTKEIIVLQESGDMEEVVVTGLFDYKSSTFTGSAVSYSQEDLKLVST